MIQYNDPENGINTSEVARDQYRLKCYDIKYSDRSIGINAPNIQDAISTLETMLEEDFENGLQTVYDAIVAKGVTPRSTASYDLARAIADIQPGYPDSSTFYATKRIAGVDMGEYNTVRYVHTKDIPNECNTTGYFNVFNPTFSDYGEDNTVRYIDATTSFEEGQKSFRSGIRSDLVVITGVTDKDPHSKTFDILPNARGFILQGGCGVTLSTIADPGKLDISCLVTRRIAATGRTITSYPVKYHLEEGNNSVVLSGHYSATLDEGDTCSIKLNLMLDRIAPARRSDAYIAVYITQWF